MREKRLGWDHDRRDEMLHVARATKRTPSKASHAKKEGKRRCHVRAGAVCTTTRADPEKTRWVDR